MSKRDDRTELDAFLAEIEVLEADALEALAGLPADLPPVAPPPEIRARILASAVDAGRFAAFAGALSKMLDVTLERARSLLDNLGTLAWEVGPIPDRSWTCWVPGGPAVRGAIRGFLRLSPEVAFPHHTHLGDETVLVIQGGFTDVDGSEARPGDVVTMRAGTHHGFRGHPGVDLLLFVVAHEGVDLGGGVVIRPADD